VHRSWGDVAVVVLGVRTPAGRATRRVSTAVLALLIAGCSAAGSTGSTSQGGSGTPADSASGSTSGSSPSTSPAGVARSQATTAYVGMWQDMAQAGTTSDWNSPKLAQYATGDALSAISRSMYADHLNGLLTKGEPKNYPKVTSETPAANPTTVMISDCGDSAHWLKYRKDTGKLADEGGGRRAITAEVKKQAAGSWKVARFAVEGLGSC
jgi:hypothetical protein